MTLSSIEPHIPPITLPALFVKFLGFGAFAFGGPVAQIAMLRAALVQDERWITPARFNRLLAVMQVLPGPEAHELCVHLGMLARGRWGGVLAGLGFMLPGLVLMLVAGWAYATWIAGATGLSAVLLGVQVAVLAIIARAVARIGQHVLEDRWLVAIAVVAFVATLLDVPFWISLVAAGAGYALTHRPAVATAIVAAAVAVAIGATWLTPVGTVAVHTAPVTLAALFVAGLKGGLLTFGGAYTAIPYVRADTVGRGWIDDATFLDGVALAGILPAPLVIFTTFVGYVAGGPAGGLAITLGMFLPAFAFSLILFERLERLVENAALHRLLAGVAAAVVGIIAATFVALGHATIQRLPHLATALALFATAAIVAWRVGGAWGGPALVAGGGVAGWFLLA